MSLAPRRIVPLSQRLPRLLAYPASQAMLWMIAALCLLRMLNHLPSLLGLLFEVAYWIMGFKLAVEALVNTAQGRFEPLGGEDLVATDGDAWEQIVLQAVVFVPIFAVGHWFGPLPMLALLGVALLVMPAATILLAIDHSLAHALNPVAWGRMIGRLGAHYFLVVLILAVLVLASSVLQWILLAVLPGTIGMLPGSFIELYALVAGFHVMGYLIHEHHAVLGLDVSQAVTRATFANPMEDEAMAQAEALQAQGRPAEAADTLEGLFRGRGASDAVHDRYHQLVAASGDRVRLAKHARDYVCSLLATGKDKRALAVLSETLAIVPDYRHELPGDVARLVAQAAKTGQSQLAVALAEEFEARFPGDENTPAVLMTVAPLMAEKLGRETDALRRLRDALQRFPDHALAAPMRVLAGEVERLQQIAGGARAR
ncbi:tetratricopeptide repeat protein [Arenimonas sp. MALMAid1274]|uniref:tetratricopeptide repeat protein n=1 Tax=Arenimonas sp. MALMAid1274 TaxID=3411630 RepID=UPI003BA110A3